VFLLVDINLTSKIIISYLVFIILIAYLYWNNIINVKEEILQESENLNVENIENLQNEIDFEVCNVQTPLSFIVNNKENFKAGYKYKIL
jgi:hypothetical protein